MCGGLGEVFGSVALAGHARDAAVEGSCIFARRRGLRGVQGPDRFVAVGSSQPAAEPEPPAVNTERPARFRPCAVP